VTRPPFPSLAHRVIKQDYGDGVDGAPNGISVPRWSFVINPSEGKPSMGKSITDLSSVTRIGLDLAKNAFQLHAVDAKGQAVVIRALKRGALLKVFASLPRCLVAMGGLFVCASLGAATDGARLRGAADPAGACEALCAQEQQRPDRHYRHWTKPLAR
jgi:hypothetical protein